MAFSSTVRSQSRLRTSLQAGLLAGTLDGLAGMWLFYNATGKNPLGVFPYIASGVYGRAAFAGNWSMLLSGVLFHYLIAMSFAFFFVWVSTQIGWVRRHWIVAGLLYGVFVWVVMNMGVLPLSHVSRGPFNLGRAALNMGILLVSVGLPISWLTHRSQRR